MLVGGLLFWLLRYVALTGRGTVSALLIPCYLLMLIALVVTCIVAITPKRPGYTGLFILIVVLSCFPLLANLFAGQLLVLLGVLLAPMGGALVVSEFPEPASPPQALASRSTGHSWPPPPGAAVYYVYVHAAPPPPVYENYPLPNPGHGFV